MKKRKITLNISEDVFELMESRIPKEEHNAFVEAAIRTRFAMMEQQKFLNEVVQHNKIINEELDEIEAGLDLEDAFMEEDEFLSDDELSEFDGL